MQRLLTSVLVAMSLCCASPGVIRAAPVNGLDITGGEDAVSRVEDTRVFCYNRYSGRFLHWGSCGGSRPRIYCRNRYTGRFLHWGSCW
jgi:hypothetical protein